MLGEAPQPVAGGDLAGRSPVVHDPQPQLGGVALEVHGDPPRVARVAHGVGDGLAHDAERGVVDGRGQGAGAPAHLHADAGEPRDPGDLVEALQARRLRALRLAQHVEGGAQLGQRGPARLLDLEQRGDGLLRAPVGDVGADAGLHRDHREAVRDDVVHVAGEAQPLLLDAPPRLLLGALAGLGLPAAQPADRDADRHRDDDPHEAVAVGRRDDLLAERDDALQPEPHHEQQRRRSRPTGAS